MTGLTPYWQSRSVTSKKWVRSAALIHMPSPVRPLPTATPRLGQCDLVAYGDGNPIFRALQVIEKRDGLGRACFAPAVVTASVPVDQALDADDLTSRTKPIVPPPPTVQTAHADFEAPDLHPPGLGYDPLSRRAVRRVARFTCVPPAAQVFGASQGPVDDVLRVCGGQCINLQNTGGTSSSQL